MKLYIIIITIIFITNITIITIIIANSSSISSNDNDSSYNSIFFFFTCNNLLVYYRKLISKKIYMQNIHFWSIMPLLPPFSRNILVTLTHLSKAEIACTSVPFSTSAGSGYLFRYSVYDYIFFKFSFIYPGYRLPDIFFSLCWIKFLLVALCF